MGVPPLGGRSEKLLAARLELFIGQLLRGVRFEVCEGSLCGFHLPRELWALCGMICGKGVDKAARAASTRGFLSVIQRDDQMVPRPGRRHVEESGVLRIAMLLLEIPENLNRPEL